MITHVKNNDKDHQLEEIQSDNDQNKNIAQKNNQIDYGQEQYQESFQQTYKSDIKKQQVQNISPKHQITKRQKQQSNSQITYSRNEPPSKANNYHQKIVKPQVKEKPKFDNNKRIQVDQQQQNENEDQQLNNQYEDSQQCHITIQNQQPQQQTYIALKENHSVKNQSQIFDQPIYKSLPKQSIYHNHSQQQLLQLCRQNQVSIKSLKKTILLHKKQMKQISLLIDKDIQKNILQMQNPSKMKSINLKLLFSQTNSSNQQPQNIKRLRQQLKNIRKNAHRIKSQVQKIQIKFADPIFIQNHIKSQQLQVKIKLISNQLFKKSQQKRYINQQLIRMKQAFGLQQKQFYDKSLQKNQQAINKLLIQIKEQRSKLYTQQKKDITLMEKLKFYIQKDQKSLLQAKLQAARSSQPKISIQEIQKQIKILVDDINRIMQERNKVENQKNRQLKQLQTQIQSKEAKNLQTLNKIRNIDSSLLQFYTHKIQKKNKKLQKQSQPHTAQKLHQTIDSGSPLIRQTKKQYIENDKNMSMSVSNTASNKFRSKIKNIQSRKPNQKQVEQFVIQTDQLQQQKQILITKKSQSVNESEKIKSKNVKNRKNSDINQKINKFNKKIYSFGDMKVDEKGAILSDQILGKVKLTHIDVFVDQTHLYGVQCKYSSKQKPGTIVGTKILQKNIQQKCQKISLTLTPQQYLKYIKVGISVQGQICYFKISSSSQKSKILQWRKIDSKSNKLQEKQFNEHQSIIIRAKLVSTQVQNTGITKSINQLKQKQKPKLILAGFAFTLNEFQKN